MDYLIDGQVIPEPDLFNVSFENIHAEGTGRNEAGIALVILLREGVRQFALHWTALEETEGQALLKLLKPASIAFTYWDPEEGLTTKNFYTDGRNAKDYGNGLMDVACNFTEI